MMEKDVMGCCHGWYECLFAVSRGCTGSEYM